MDNARDRTHGAFVHAAYPPTPTPLVALNWTHACPVPFPDEVGTGRTPSCADTHLDFAMAACGSSDWLQADFGL